MLYSVYIHVIFYVYFENLSCLFSPMYNHQYWWNIVWSRNKYKISILPWKWNRISCIIIIHLTWLYDNGCKYKILISPWKQGIRYLLLMWILHDFTNSCKYKILVSPWKRGIRYHLVRKKMNVNEHERLSKHYTWHKLKWRNSRCIGLHLP